MPAAGMPSIVNAMPRYLPGRIICASAGNLRAFNLHWQATIPAGGEVSMRMPSPSTV